MSPEILESLTFLVILLVVLSLWLIPEYFIRQAAAKRRSRLNAMPSNWQAERPRNFKLYVDPRDVQTLSQGR